MHSWFILALVSVTWVIFGYTLAFGPSQGGLIGGLDHLFLRGIGTEPGAYATTIPAMLFVVYQMMFAIITPALITGAFAERKSFNAFVVFAFLWSTLVYLPLCHWVWNTDGWIYQLGALDFAGGLVVHISSGVAALVAALYLGRRIRAESERFEPHNVTYVVLGGALLWFGWFGFNAGSAWAANGLAVNALMVTNTAAGRSLAHVALHRLAPQGRPVDRRRGLGGGCRPRRDHAGVGLRRHQRGARHRLRGGLGLLRGDPPARAPPGGRRPRRVGRARRRRHASARS